MAMEFEAATKGAQEVVKVEPDRDKAAGEVHAVAKQSTDERTGKCFLCGRRNHTAGQCPHNESVCYNCGKKGHIQRTCLQLRKAERVQGREVRRLMETVEMKKCKVIRSHKSTLVFARREHVLDHR